MLPLARRAARGCSRGSRALASGGRAERAVGLGRSGPMQMLCLRLTGNRRHQTRHFYSTLAPSDAVTVNYKHGLPAITLMLPSRKERCQFTVKPMLMTVGDFLQDVKNEDNAIEKGRHETAKLKAPFDGIMISTSALMEVLLMNDFKLVINGAEYSVHPPQKDKVCTEHATELDDIKSTVHRLFEALHLEDHQRKREKDLMQKMERLREELLPLEQLKQRVTADVDAKTSRLLWTGLALMSTQGGALAWLTWWVYSWDIMEPVTYFITYGSAMAFYAYFVLTKQDYIYPEVRDRQFLHYFHRKSRSQKFNVDQYNKLKEELAQVEASLKRLKNPLKLRLPMEEINEKH